MPLPAGTPTEVVQLQKEGAAVVAAVAAARCIGGMRPSLLTSGP